MFNWQSFAPKAENIGTFLGKTAGDYLSEKLGGMAVNAAKREAGELPESANDPFAGIEDMLGAAWQGLKGIKADIRNIQNSITGLAGGAFDYLTGGLLSGANEGLFGIGKDIGEGLTAFAQRTGKLLTEGYFASDEEVRDILARERIKEAIKNGTALEYGSEEYNRMMAVVNAKISNGSDADSKLRADEKQASYKNNKDVDSSLKNLTDLAQQNGGGSE